MAGSTGLVLAAAGLAVANDVAFAPMAQHKPVDLTKINWKIIPATAILALMLDGLGKLSPGFATSLAGITLGLVLVTPVSGSKSPVDNLTKAMGYKNG